MLHSGYVVFGPLIARLHTVVSWQLDKTCPTSVTLNVSCGEMDCVCGPLHLMCCWHYCQYVVRTWLLYVVLLLNSSIVQYSACLYWMLLACGAALWKTDSVKPYLPLSHLAISPTSVHTERWHVSAEWWVVEPMRVTVV